MSLLSKYGRVLDGGAVFGAILIMAALGLNPAAGADWTAQFITSDSPKNWLDSPPASDDTGNMVAVWERSTLDGLPYLYVGRSDNGGETWTVGDLRSTTAMVGIADRNPVVSTDKAGNWLTVWSSNDSLSNSVGTDYDVMFSRSLDAGATWSDPQALNSTAASDVGNDTQPWVSMDNAGNCVAAWTSDNDVTDVSGTTATETCVWLSRSTDGGATWTPATALTGNTYESLAQPRLANSGIGKFAFVWTGHTAAETTGTVNFAFTDNGGTSWTETSVLNSDTGSTIPAGLSLDPEVAGDGDNHWMIAWNSTYPLGSTMVLSYIARTPDNGETWLSVVSSKNGNDQLSPSIYTDSAGMWVMGAQGKSGSSRVISSPNFGESWGGADKFPSTIPHPYISESRESTPYVWKSNVGTWRALFGKKLVGTYLNPDYNPQGYYEIRRATFISAAAPIVNNDWTQARNYMDGLSPLVGSEPEISADAGKTWVAVYSTTPSGGGGDQEIGFSRSTNGGQSWTGSQILNSDWQTDGLKDQSPSISASDGPVWLCVWRRADYSILLSRSEDYGASWSVPQIVNVEGMGAATGVHPGISCLGAHKWIITWQQATNSTIYTSVSLDDGNTWGPPVFVQASYQRGWCGNTTPCSIINVHSPRVFSAPGYPTVYTGFLEHTTDRPNGYSGPIQTYSSVGGRRSNDGGMTYTGSVGGSYPSYSGSNEMAVDDKDNWMAVSFVRFSGNFTPAATNRTNLWGKVAMDHAGHRLRLWASSQKTGLGSATQVFPIFTLSEDAGQTWSGESRIDTANANGSNQPVDMMVKGSANGDFVAVWQSSAGTILFSSLNKFQKTEASGDWGLYQ